MAAELDTVLSLYPEPIQVELKKILASRILAGSGQLRPFLRFTVEQTLRGHGDQIKEYTLGVEACAGGESSDQQTDNIVRAKAGKLRSKLEAYYSTEGCDDPLLIEYPKGSYVPVFRGRELPAPEPPARFVLRRKMLWAATAAAAMVAVAAYWIIVKQRPKPAAGSAVPSIAVLPFVDMSAGKDQEYFCDGITEELINTLAKVEGLRVVARTSAFEFKGKGQDIRKIGGQLNVGAVLEGSVRKAGDKLRVTAQLNNVADGYHLWSETYDREMKDVFAIQEEISQAIVNILRVKLAANRPVLVKRYSDDLEVYNLYLKGRHDLNTTRTERLKVAIEEFERAL